MEDYEVPQYKWGMLDNAGNHIIKPIYDDLKDAINPNFIGANLKGKWGYINIKGENIIPHQFKSITDFNEGYAWVQNFKDSWHIIDESGKLSDTLFIQTNRQFNSGLAPVLQDNYWVYVGIDGKPPIDEKYLNASEFNNGAAIIKTANGYGVINTRQDLIIPDQYTSLKPDNFGYLGKQNGKYFYLNNDGNKRWAHDGYDKALVFEGRHSIVKQGLEWRIITNKGKEIKQLDYDNLDYGGQSIFKAKSNGKWGFLNDLGEVICDPVFTNTYRFEEDRVVVSDGDNWGYYDKQCNEILEPQFTLAWGYKNGYARVISDRTIQMIDTDGNIVPNIRHIELRDFNNGLARFQYFPFLEKVLEANQ